MSSNAAGRRRTRDELEDDESEGTSTPSAASDSPKRPRLNSHANGTSSARNGRAGRQSGGPTLSNGTLADEYQAGAIVRVKVENFVTYEKAEFFPGPHLNMVIGPNGTGKSSLVCAICLGLGYGPKHLGRAGSVKEFVKHGKDIATIEIELRKRPEDRNNYIIRVQIRREQNSQKWWLNGKESSHKAIQNLMRTLKIQVDNLCQFLPQDRVVEFAACTPIDLLHETMRAAAPEEMLQWQEQLRGLHKDKKDLGETVQTDADTLKNLENRQQGLQADVDRIREREEIETNVKNLKSALVLAQYQEARTSYEEARNRKRAAERSLKDFEQESGPSLQAVNDKQSYARQVETVIPGRKNLVDAAERKCKRLSSEVVQASDNVKDFNAKIEAERKSFETKKKELAISRQKLTALQAEQKNPPSAFNAADWTRKIVS